MIKHSPKNRPPMTDELREKGKKRNKRLRRELNLNYMMISRNYEKEMNPIQSKTV